MAEKDGLEAQRRRLLSIGHCPWDTKEDEEAELTEPYCHANRDGDCKWVYCPQPLIRARELALWQERDEWKARAEQAETQLAGCGVAALGWSKGEQRAKPGDWGYSASYQDVLNLREKWEATFALRQELEGLAAKWDNERAIDYQPSGVTAEGKGFEAALRICSIELTAILGKHFGAARPEQEKLERLLERINDFIDNVAEENGHVRVSAPHDGCEICELRAAIKGFVNQHKEQQSAK